MAVWKQVCVYLCVSWPMVRGQAHTHCQCVCPRSVWSVDSPRGQKSAGDWWPSHFKMCLYTSGSCEMYIFKPQFIHVDILLDVFWCCKCSQWHPYSLYLLSLFASAVFFRRIDNILCNLLNPVFTSCHWKWVMHIDTGCKTFSKSCILGST